MNPGKLNQQIVIKRFVDASDGMGGSTSTQSTILTCWAEVRTPKSRDGIVGGRDLDIRTHEVIIRKSGIEPARGDKVEWGTKVLDVKAVREYASDNVYALDCVLT